MNCLCNHTVYIKKQYFRRNARRIFSAEIVTPICKKHLSGISFFVFNLNELFRTVEVLNYNIPIEFWRDIKYILRSVSWNENAG